jgi:hypothetical protein
VFLVAAAVMAVAALPALTLERRGAAVSSVEAETGPML